VKYFGVDKKQSCPYFILDFGLSILERINFDTEVAKQENHILGMGIEIQHNTRAMNERKRK